MIGIAFFLNDFVQPIHPAVNDVLHVECHAEIVGPKVLVAEEVAPGKLTARAQILATLVRVYAPGQGPPGDPYLWAACVRGADDGAAEIVGVVGAPPKRYVWAIAGELARLGFTAVRVRRADGRNIHHDLRRLCNR